jgi:hypothetical protein
MINRTQRCPQQEACRTDRELECSTIYDEVAATRHQWRAAIVSGEVSTDAAISRSAHSSGQSPRNGTVNSLGKVGNNREDHDGTIYNFARPQIAIRAAGRVRKVGEKIGFPAY